MESAEVSIANKSTNWWTSEVSSFVTVPTYILLCVGLFGGMFLFNGSVPSINIGSQAIRNLCTAGMAVGGGLVGYGFGKLIEPTKRATANN
jgi:hypothetical protein